MAASLKKKSKSSAGGRNNRTGVFLMAGWKTRRTYPLRNALTFISKVPPHELEALVKGVPSIGSGMVYPVSEQMIVCEPFDIPTYWPRVFGIDFGWKDPTAVLFAARADRDNDILYFYSEYAVSERTPQQHVYDLMSRGIDWIPGVYDPSGKISKIDDGKNLVELYRNAGLSKLYPANNSRELVCRRLCSGCWTAG